MVTSGRTSLRLAWLALGQGSGNNVMNLQLLYLELKTCQVTLSKATRLGFVVRLRDHNKLSLGTH